MPGDGAVPLGRGCWKRKDTGRTFFPDVSKGLDDGFASSNFELIRRRSFRSVSKNPVGRRTRIEFGRTIVREDPSEFSSSLQTPPSPLLSRSIDSTK